MFVKEQEGEPYKTEIQKVNKDRHMRPVTGYMGKIRCVQQYCPGGNNQQQHDHIFPREFKVVGIYQVGKKIGKEKGKYGNDNIKYRKEGIEIFLMSDNFCHRVKFGLNYESKLSV